MLDGALVPATAWRLNFGGDPADAAPKLGKTPGARKRPKSPQDILGQNPESDEWIANAEFILETIMPNSDRGLTPAWSGARCEKYLMPFVAPN